MTSTAGLRWFRPSAAWLAAATLLVGLAAACSGTDDDEPSGHAAAPSQGGGVSEPANGAIELPLGDAHTAVPGGDYIVLQSRRTTLSHGRHWSALAYDSQRRVLAVVSGQSDGTSLPHQALQVESPSGEVLFNVPRLAGAQARQVVFGILTPRVVVWKETQSRDLETDQWSMYAYSIDSGTTREIAAQPTSDRGTVSIAPGGTFPSIANDGLVYFSSVDVPDQGDPVVRVHAVSTHGGALRTVTKGSGAVAAGGYVFWVRDVANGFKVMRAAVEAPTHASAVFTSSGTGCRSISGLAAAPDGGVAYTLRCGDTNRVFFHDAATKAATLSVSAKAVGYLHITNDFGWFATATKSGAYRQYLVRFADASLLKIGRGKVSGDAVVNDEQFSWVTYGATQGEATIARLKG